MKKHILTLLVLALTSFTLHARPVDQETAKRLGQAFVKANFEFTRQSSDMRLVKTAFSDRGEACYYVYNVGETGFVILAADDNYRPIIGYSDEGTFNPDDMAPALVDYLEVVRQGVMMAANASSATVSVAADWAMLEKTGRLVSRHGGRADEYLVETKWNQSYPYNYFCPAAPNGSGGHCYAGCVATAASQVMKYWNHPLIGQGSYSYVPESHPEYGVQYANFGETTYDWENMPVSINSNSPQVQIEAIALLQYHVGISVNMNYRPDGSGAATNDLPQKMPMYFLYTNAMTIQRREDYTHEEYMNLLINTFDMRWPIVHAGGGHAYVFDGYNDYDQIHMNWGWGGSSDGWFNVDEHGYTDGQRGIFNYVPAEIYAATSDAPTNLNVVATDEQSLSTTVTWNNPAVTLTNAPLENIDQIVVERNGQVVYTEDNVTPGAEMSILDESIPYYDSFDYSVYAIVNGQRGTSAVFKNVLVGPTCNWKIIMQSAAFQGWNGGYVSLYSGTGIEIQRMTISNSIPATMEFAVPIGRGSFGWTAPVNNVNNLSFIIKDSEGNTVYTFSGASSGIEAGIFLSFNNGCGNEGDVEAPAGLTAEVVDGVAVLSWNASVDPMYGYNIYRDDHLYAMTDSGSRSFVDEGFDAGHCYTVTALDAVGESAHSNETCASSGDCLGATNFDFEYVGNNYKIKLLWDKPEPADGLSGYYLYRRKGEEGNFERIKLLSASATSYTDNTANQQGDYYYRLYAYYSTTDCTSAPASLKMDSNMFTLKVYYSPTAITESQTKNVSLFPNPADKSLKIEAEGMTQVTVYNMLGQAVFSSNSESDQLLLDVAGWCEGVYLVKVETVSGQAVQRVSVVH
jgi:hypothetical protein